MLKGRSSANVPISPVIHTFTKAFADDLNLTTTTAKDNQLLLDRTDKWLVWTETMKAKPRKCVSLAFRQFRKHAKSRDGFTQLKNSVYSPYDPKLTISGSSFRSLVPHTIERKHGDPILTNFSGSHFKFLGRLICPDLWDKCTKSNLSEKYWSLVKLIDSAPVNGFAKLWLYQFGLLSQLNWPFMIYDFNITMAKSWDRRT